MKTEKFDRTDWKISKDTYKTSFAKSLGNHPEDLKAFKRHIIDNYNKTKELDILLENLKVIAMAEGRVAELAKKTNMQRTSVYKVLSKQSNPSFNTVVSLAHNLGIDFRLSTMVR
jgi:probable addiction module antidote protein